MAQKTDAVHWSVPLLSSLAMMGFFCEVRLSDDALKQECGMARTLCVSNICEFR